MEYSTFTDNEINSTPYEGGEASYSIKSIDVNTKDKVEDESRYLSCLSYAKIADITLDLVEQGINVDIAFNVNQTMIKFLQEKTNEKLIKFDTSSSNYKMEDLETNHIEEKYLTDDLLMIQQQLIGELHLSEGD